MKAPFWQYLIPKYGNYGGPGWSGGAMMSSYNEVDWNINPVDSLDECFYNHDNRYQSAISKEVNGEINEIDKMREWLEADKELIRSMESLSIDPKEWEHKPTNIFYAWLYRKLAIFAFISKVWLHDLVHS